IGPASAQRILDHMTEATDPLGALCTLPSPPRAGDDWTSFVEMIGNLRYSEWPADLERARLWYEPHLQRIHEDAEVRRADLVQLGGRHLRRARGGAPPALRRNDAGEGPSPSAGTAALLHPWSALTG